MDEAGGQTDGEWLHWWTSPSPGRTPCFMEAEVGSDSSLPDRQVDPENHHGETGASDRTEGPRDRTDG